MKTSPMGPTYTTGDARERTQFSKNEARPKPGLIVLNDCAKV